LTKLSWLACTKRSAFAFTAKSEREREREREKLLVFLLSLASSLCFLNKIVTDFCDTALLEEGGYDCLVYNGVWPPEGSTLLSTVWKLGHLFPSLFFSFFFF
jgi:hypothetical protein